MAITWDLIHADHAASNGGLTITDNANAFDASRSSHAVSSRLWYWEVRVDATPTADIIIGAAVDPVSTYPGQAGTASWGYYGVNGTKVTGGAFTAYGSTYGAGSVIGVALDLAAGKIWFAKNNVWQGGGDPVAGTNPAFTGVSGAVMPAVGMYAAGSGITGRFKAGDQSYAPPAGFLPLEVSTVVAGLVQSYGLKMGADLVQPYANAPVVQLALLQPWGDAGILVAPLVQRWRDMVALAAPLTQPWAIMAQVHTLLAQPWAITSASVQGLLVQGYSLRDVELLQAVLAQPWAIVPDSELLTYQVEVMANGLPVGISHLNIEADLGQDVLSCEIHPGCETDYLRCTIGASLQITLTVGATVEVYQFVITAPRIDEQWGAARYIVEAMSPACWLGEPWATPIDGELSGMAATIAQTLAGSIPVDWQTVDWPIPAATWIASGQTPLALLKQLAGAVGAVVQSLPDGTLRVLPEYPLPLPTWAEATADATLTETLDCATTGATPDHRPGYNQYLISDQASSADTLRLEETAISINRKEVRGYQTPWTGLFALTHTGGDWVQIEDLGIEQRQETETIEIVGGSGRTQYPIISRDAVAWLHTNLGTVTVAEDGTVTAAIAGESLLELTYTTRCRLWRVTDPNNEQLQLVATHE